jgi:hypothetical protein
MTKKELLGQVDDLLRSMPPRDAFGGNDTPLAWVGRAVAAIQRWNIAYMPYSNAAAQDLRSLMIEDIARGYSEMTVLLHQARADLQMEIGQLSVVVQQGNVFDYFDGIRKMIETARVEVFFVDAYLDADVVTRYLPYVAPGATIRLLGGPKKLATLLPAVDMFAQQHQRPIQVRTSNALHDRFLFVDRKACYLSGASFKDGAKHAPAVLTQITDAFQAMWETFDGLWNSAKVER